MVIQHSITYILHFPIEKCTLHISLFYKVMLKDFPIPDLFQHLPFLFLHFLPHSFLLLVLYPFLLYLFLVLYPFLLYLFLFLCLFHLHLSLFLYLYYHTLFPPAVLTVALVGYRNFVNQIGYLPKGYTVALHY